MINNLYIKATPTTATVTWGSITGTLSDQTDLQSALNAKQATLVSGTTIKTLEGQSLLGSGNIDLTKSDVGLANVDNTSDLNKPISTATQTALNAKQNTLTLTTTGTSGAATLVGSTLNIPQYGGGGGSNPATFYINSTGGTTVGTPLTNEISLSVLIPANTLTSNCQFQLIYKIKRIVGTASILTGSVFFNTSNNLTGATQIVASPSIGTTINFATIIRNFHITSGNLNYLSISSGGLSNDYTTGNLSTTPFDVTIDNYFLLTIRTVGGGDTARTDTALLIKYF